MSEIVNSQVFDHPSIMQILADDSFDGSEGLLAIIIRRDFTQPGITFFTESKETQQVALMSHPAGKVIEPHLHRDIPRRTYGTQEVIFVRSGIIRLDVFDSAKRPAGPPVILRAGDVVILLHGGHGMKVIEDAEFFETKNGPFLGTDNDKVMFQPKGE